MSCAGSVDCLCVPKRAQRVARWCNWGGGSQASFKPTGVCITCRMSWLLKTLLGSGHPCLFVGESGTSKSVTIASYLSGLDSSHLTLNMNFSSRTSSLDVQHAIEDSIEKRTKVQGSTGPVMSISCIMSSPADAQVPCF